ncbi:MAG: hypothetical protein ACT4OJ_08160, partial [Bacteroidota bacterium]
LCHCPPSLGLAQFRSGSSGCQACFVASPGSCRRLAATKLRQARIRCAIVSKKLQLIMKRAFPLLLLFTVQICIAQNEPEFGLYFGNDFKSDSVTIIINDIQVAKNIKLRDRMIDPENLMIEQTNKKLTVRPYGESVQLLKKVKIKQSILVLDIYMNTNYRHFVIDLKKGKYLYAEYKFFRVGWHSFKILQIFQWTLPPLMF